MSLIGISGHIGAGKTALARIMYTHYGYEPKVFAAKLKEIAAIISGKTIGSMYTAKDVYLPEWNMTIGEMQQRIGTELFRDHFDPNTWVKALFTQYTSNMNWTISDLRFPNEAQAIRDRGGFLVRIMGSRTGPGQRDPNHISERALDDWQDWDYVFENVGSLDTLRKHAGDIIMREGSTRMLE